MKNPDEERKRNLKIIQAFDEVIRKGPWRESTFLKATGRRIKQIRDSLKKDLEIDSVTEQYGENPNTLASRVAVRTGQVEVYVSLYNTNGNNMGQWERTLNSLGRNSILNRPVYSSENDVRAYIRAQDSKINDAYIAIYVDSNDVLPDPEDKGPRDKLDHKLLIIRDGAIKPENITRFMHSTGHYMFKDSKLVRQGDAEYMDYI